MAKCNQLTSLTFKGLMLLSVVEQYLNYGFLCCPWLHPKCLSMGIEAIACAFVKNFFALLLLCFALSASMKNC